MILNFGKYLLMVYILIRKTTQTKLNYHSQKIKQIKHLSVLSCYDIKVRTVKVENYQGLPISTKDHIIKCITQFFSSFLYQLNSEIRVANLNASFKDCLVIINFSFLSSVQYIL